MKRVFPVLFTLLFTQFCAEEIQFTDYPFGSNFLMESGDKPVKPFSEISSEVNLIFFGFTYCPDVCPMGLSRMYNAFKDVPKKEHPGMFLITVDPDRDTYHQLENYLSHSFPGVQGIRLDKSTTAKTYKDFAVGVKKIKEAGKWDIIHSSSIFLTDKKGNVKYMINSTVDSEQIRKIVQAYKRKTGI